ncbi:MAG: RagB/SusD family nutrient uptake outer membrane protein [Bacteroidales bacterium]|jgi:hypothetical protein|nr:RagB/SusD family nutrient uptake outer membrane protein [Bacteroidales bacterium]MCI2121918.1 RagB/SusD family nutrient uptake outer membrane protein [Bacteroidales bacterium]MCI2145620.1 RagB/SusD family nutrient uptake outer membrane protein [Bacteroidales bacterium]
MKYRYLFLGLIVSTLLCSCSESDLTQQPTTLLSDETVIKTAETVKAVLMGGYAYTGDYRYQTILDISLDVMGDDFHISSGAYGFPTYNWIMYSYDYAQVPSSNPWWTGYCSYIWRYGYKAIDQCNEIIANAESLPEGCDDYLAQAHALRAYNMLKMCDAFAGAYNADPDGPGIVLRLEPGSADASKDPGRSTIKDAYEQIISDLKYAYENCTNEDTQYITKKSAALLLSRVYLAMDDYEDCSTYAKAAASDVFDGSNLMSQSEWQSGFTDHNDEWLWYFNFTPETCNYYASIPSFWWLASCINSSSKFGSADYGRLSTLSEVESNSDDNHIMEGYSTVRANNSFVAMFDKGDCRAMFPFYFYKEDGYFVSKFGWRTCVGDAEYPMGRIAEAYLNEAEAELGMSNPGVAKSVLNALQVKRGASTTDATVDGIWKERRKELYGEAFALPDIKRLRKPLERTGVDHWSKVTYLPADSPRFMFPIPLTELDYNPNMTAEDQNEYWR